MGQSEKISESCNEGSSFPSHGRLGAPCHRPWVVLVRLAKWVDCRLESRLEQGMEQQWPTPWDSCSEERCLGDWIRGWRKRRLCGRASGFTRSRLARTSMDKAKGNFSLLASP